MSDSGRRAADTMRVVDGLVASHLRDATLGGRPLARLAAAVAIEHSGASWGALLFARGRGFEPELQLRHDLGIASGETAKVDRALVARAQRAGEVAARPDTVAAPVVLGGVTRAVLYLDGLDGRGEATSELASAITQRIATFLRSAELLDQVARQERGLQALERLGTLLGDRQLIGKHLELAAETARDSTASDFGLMARLGPDGSLQGASLSGDGPVELEALAAALGRELAASGTLDDITLPVRQAICEPIWRSSLAGDGQQVAVGVLAVGRAADRPYEAVDRTLVGALANLIGGALAREEYFRRAAEDPLTETGTRLALQLSLAEAQNRAIATGRSFAVVIADLDGFKEVNDRYGHLIGDEVLRGVARLLRERLRSQDFVARYGGDEFVLVLPETSAEEAERLAAELGALVAAARFTEHRISVSLSIGIAGSSHSESEAERLLMKADRALYRSKAAGRDRVTRAGEDP